MKRAKLENQVNGIMSDAKDRRVKIIADAVKARGGKVKVKVCFHFYDGEGLTAERIDCLRVDDDGRLIANAAEFDHERAGVFVGEATFDDSDDFLDAEEQVVDDWASSGVVLNELYELVLSVLGQLP